jgi:uncharacterized membrane protein
MSERKARHQREARYLAVDRLAALTDGVFAIAITLLALEVTVPIVEAGVSGSDLGSALLEQWPSYAAYVVTFFLVGAYWFNHHRMFNLLRGVDHRFLVLNIFFLMAIAIMPFPNALLAEYLLEPEQQGVAIGVYGLAMMTLAVMFNLVWWYAGWRQRLLRPDCDYRLVRQVLNSYLMGPVAYGIGVVVSSSSEGWIRAEPPESHRSGSEAAGIHRMTALRELWASG